VLSVLQVLALFTFDKADLVYVKWLTVPKGTALGLHCLQWEMTGKEHKYGVISTDSINRKVCLVPNYRKTSTKLECFMLNDLVEYPNVDVINAASVLQQRDGGEAVHRKGKKQVTFFQH
jgi:hypothetical protein